ncbi:MAG: hypothetical protein JJ863_24390 [Deltaproteobacteria bacterium]|nr:hypothetical protein [Deltaproteobacteria bacterium]
MRLATLLLALALGCGDDGGGTDDPVTDGAVRDASRDADVLECDGGGCVSRRCRLLDYYEGPAEDGLVVGEMQDEAFVAYEAGGDATYVFGFQGGVMIQPVVDVPAERVADEPCAQITFRHRPDPAYPDDAGEVEFFSENVFIDTLEAVDTRFRGGAYADQMGWAAADGVRMILEAEVRGPDWALRTELPVRVVDQDGWDECDVVPTTFAIGCELVELSGAATVESVGDTTGLACAATAPVTLTLAPSDVVVPEGCYELTRTIDVERGCIDDQGLAPGVVLDEVFWTFPADPEQECYETLGVVERGCDCL